VDVLVSWPGGSWEATTRLGGLLIGAYLLLLWLATVLWVVRDVRDRTKDQVAQWVGIGLVVVFPLIGAPLYLIIRPAETLAEAYEREVESEALIAEIQAAPACPQCRRRVEDEFVYCPNCRTTLREACRSCARPVAVVWRHCPHCGNPQRPAAPPRPTRAERDEAEYDAQMNRAAETAPRPRPARPATGGQPRRQPRREDDLD